jgi:hypothetical protein
MLFKIGEALLQLAQSKDAVNNALNITNGKVNNIAIDV